MFFDSWHDLVRVAVVGVLAYIALIFLLRISGKRTLSKLNAFDLIVTIALGSTLASILLSKDVSLLEGILAFSLLIFLQYIATWLSVRSGKVKHVLKSEPTLLFYQGKLLRHAMKRVRIMDEEIRAVMRQQGISDVDEVDSVVLETDGSLSVLKKSGGSSGYILQDVQNAEEAKAGGENGQIR